MKFAPGNAQHIGERSEQQDSFGFSDPADRAFVAHGGVAAVVADGMGGLANGSAASCTAVQTFLKAYESKLPEEPIPDALLRAIQSANRAVMDLSLESGRKDSLGTTLAAVALHEDWLYWVSAGDSRVYFYQDGRLVRLTTDHNYAADLQEQVSKGRITREQAVTHPERESLTSYLGLEQLPHVDRSLRAFPIKPGDCVLICSDGLYRTLSDDEIALSFEKDPHKTCDALVQRAVAKQNARQDNMTVVVLRCQEEASFAVRLLKPLAAAALVAAVIAGGFFFLFRPVPSIPPPGTGSLAPPPVVAFAAVPPLVEAGGSVTLSWAVAGGVSEVTLNDQKVKAVDSRTITDVQSETTYTLTAKGLGGLAVTRAIDVRVSFRTPVITVFTASPDKIVAGQPAVLNWRVQNANAVRIDPAPGGEELPLVGSLKVSPDTTTTYKLTASAAEKQAGVKRTITVVPPPRASGKRDSKAIITVAPPAPTHKNPVKISFESDKSAIRRGDPVTLRWKVTGDVNSVALDNGIGPVNQEGILIVTPHSKTVYTLTATNGGGIASTALVTIDIVPEPKNELFEAVVDGQADGTRITLRPDVAKVATLRLAEGLPVNSLPLNRHTLTAEGLRGAASKSALQPQAAVLPYGMLSESHMTAGPNRVFQTARVCEKGGRPNNEDFCGFRQLDDSILWVVADGLGGHNGGELASRTAVETVLESFRCNPEVTGSALESHFAAAQEAILSIQRQDPTVAGMRTTLVALISDSRGALWAHVGDSRLYRFQARGLIAQTEDHSVPQSLVKAGEISSNQIRGHPDRNRLLRSLGEKGPVRASILERLASLSSTDAFLLCTDGFWENVFEIEMMADLVASDSPEEWLDRTTSRLRARAQGEYDNYSALAVFCCPGDAAHAKTMKANELVRESPGASRPAQRNNRFGLSPEQHSSAVRGEATWMEA